MKVKAWIQIFLLPCGFSLLQCFNVKFIKEPMKGKKTPLYSVVQNGKMAGQEKVQWPSFLFLLSELYCPILL